MVSPSRPRTGSGGPSSASGDISGRESGPRPPGTNSTPYSLAAFSSWGSNAGAVLGSGAGSPASSRNSSRPAGAASTSIRQGSRSRPGRRGALPGAEVRSRPHPLLQPSSVDALEDLLRALVDLADMASPGSFRVTSWAGAPRKPSTSPSAYASQMPRTTSRAAGSSSDICDVPLAALVRRRCVPSPAVPSRPGSCGARFEALSPTECDDPRCRTFPTVARARDPGAGSAAGAPTLLPSAESGRILGGLPNSENTPV